MKTFKITYSNGKTSLLNADLTVEQVINQTFGLTPEQMTEHGASVEEVKGSIEDEDEVVEDEPKDEVVEDSGAPGPAVTSLEGFAPSVSQTNLPAEEPAAAPVPKASKKK